MHIQFKRSEQKEKHHENTKKDRESYCKKLKIWKGRLISTTATDME